MVQVGEGGQDQVGAVAGVRNHQIQHMLQLESTGCTNQM